MEIGFTGTRHGMNSEQKLKLKELLEGYNPLIAHHGDCVGADEQFHHICVDLGGNRIYEIVIHPPDKSDLRAFCSSGNIIMLKEKSYLTRNRDIVDACELLITAPHPTLPSRGTEYTINYAKKIGRKVIIL